MARILVVEDSADIAELIVHYLQRSGHGVVTLATGTEVMAEVRARRPDVIVLWTLESVRRSSGKRQLAAAEPFDREIAGHPRFRRDYRFVREFTFREKTVPGSGYYLAVFERRVSGGR